MAADCFLALETSPKLRINQAKDQPFAPLLCVLMFKTMALITQVYRTQSKHQPA